jgi:hypothetical protein
MMDQRKQAALARQIVRIAENTSDFGQTGKRRTRELSYQSVAFALLDDVADEYDDVIRRLLGHADWGEKFSEKYVDNSLRQLVAEILSEGESGTDASERASKGLTALIAHLEGYSEEHTCYVPLVGLRLGAGNVEVGQVVLKELSEEEVDRLVRTVVSITQRTKHSEEEKQSFIPMQENLLRSLQGTVCAEFRTVAEPDRARERAETESRRVLDLLRFTLPTLYSPNWNVAVGLAGEVFQAQRITPTLSGSRFNVNVVSVGPHMDLDLSEASIKVMQEIGVFELSEILRKPLKSLSDFEETLLRAIHWFADAETQPELDNQLLSLITCLETFLTPRDSRPIRTTVAEGVAMIVTEGLERRMALKKFVLRVYDQRSAVSHGGRMGVLQTDLGRLKEIAHALIRVLIQRKAEFARRKDLASWLEEQRLARAPGC